MSDQQRLDLVQRFFSGTGSSYDRTIALATLGFDRQWKKKILELVPENPARIMDQACGTGILTFMIAQRFPASHVVGVDLMEEYLVLARNKAQDLHVKNVEFIQGRAEEVFPGEGFDCITSSFLAKYVDLEALIRNNRRMLRSGGVLIVHDLTYPAHPLYARLWEFYFKILQTIGKWKYPEWEAIVQELPQLIRGTNWIPEMVRILGENGFSNVSVQSLTFGMSAIVSARKDQEIP
jgi:demethylmenaquinone methyltransferase / 2-methoxy-6-polyprenyl-1,4-benzoquinol methylase